MDAMLKRRVKRVATLHFGLTGLIILILLLEPAAAFSGSAAAARRFQESLVWRQAWENVIVDFACLLQPQIWFAEIFFNLGHAAAYWTSFLSFPIWSYCFGWLFVKFDNWLNHFPVLGKKVF